MSFISKFTKRDLMFAVLTGLITGVIAWRVFDFLKVPEFHAVPWVVLAVVVPVLWILGVLLGYFLGQWMGFFDQFGKFAAIGFTNAAVTFAVLDILLARTGYTAGSGYVLISAIAFIVGMLSSYIWNKYWAFNAARSGGGRTEFIKFISVALVSLLVNVVISSAVANFIHPIFGLNANQWANIAAVVGSAAGLIFSFVGFKIAVFK
jgi:putative flippase GtrA